MDHETLRHLTKLELQIKERMTTYTDTLARGAVKDWAEYRHIVGKIDAFRQLLHILQGLARDDEDEDD
jgi:hypothetical protein